MRTGEGVLKKAIEQLGSPATVAGKAAPRPDLAAKFSAQLGEAHKLASDKPAKGRDARGKNDGSLPFLQKGKEQMALAQRAADETPKGQESGTLPAILPGLAPPPVQAAEGMISASALHPSVERMAAAIAEVAPSPDLPTAVRIDFGAGSLKQVASEAVLTLGVHGDLSVRVSGFVPPVRGPGRAEFEADLRRSLERRRLKLAEVSVAARRL